MWGFCTVSSVQPWLHSSDLRGSCWIHSHSLGVTAPNAPNYHRDHFWLSPPTSVPFISSTSGISFPFHAPSTWCYCQCEGANLSHALICSVSAATMSASFAKSNLSVWNVESHQTLTLLISTTLSDTFHQDLELLFTIGSNVSVHFHCHLVVNPNGPSSLPGDVDLIFIVYTG